MGPLRQLHPAISAEAHGKIVFDLSAAVDIVRRRENKQLREAGDDRLAGTRYDWLRHPARMEPENRRQFAALRDSNLNGPGVGAEGGHDGVLRLLL